MISVGPGRASAGCGGLRSVKGTGRNQPIHGRQGKSAAFGWAQVVGRVDVFRHFHAPADRRFPSKGERFQRSKRHRTFSQLASAR